MCLSCNAAIIPHLVRDDSIRHQISTHIKIPRKNPYISFYLLSSLFLAPIYLPFWWARPSVDDMSSPEKSSLDLESQDIKMDVPTLSAVPSRLPQLQRQRLQRTGSISITTGPSRVNPGPKIVGDFRTLRYASPHTRKCHGDLGLMNMCVASMLQTQKKGVRTTKGRKTSQVGVPILPPCPILSYSYIYSFHLFLYPWRPIQARMAHPSCLRNSHSPRRYSENRA